MAKHSWFDIKSENVISAIARFKSENPSYPEPKTYYLMYENEKLPAKHIRGMAYEEAFGESISKSEYSGGMETKRFFERLGFNVISYDQKAEIPKQYDSWTIISDSIVTKKCDKSFFEHRGSVIPIPVRYFFGADSLQTGQKINLSLVFNGKTFSGEITITIREGSPVTRLFWRGSGLGNHFDAYRPSEKDEYPVAEFEKIAENTYIVSLYKPEVKGVFAVNDAVWIATATLSYEKYYQDNCRDISSFSFVQSDIKKRAQLLTNGNVDSARMSWWCCGDQPNHSKAFLKAVEPGANRRLSFPGEFSDSTTEPSGLDMSLSVDTSLGKVSLKQLFDFVHMEYAAMENQKTTTDIDYIGVLDYLINNQEVPYSNPEAPGINPEERSRLLAIKDKGQKAVGEIKKMTTACARAFKLDKCMGISWLDGSNTKTRRYLWAQMKYSKYGTNPTSISIFVEKRSDNTAYYRVSLELKNDGTDKKTVERYHTYLDIPIDFSQGLVLVSGSNEWGRPAVINDSPESAKVKIKAGEYRKVQLSKIIERKPDETNEYFHEELIKAVQLLIPYYNHVLGIDSPEEAWFPSKEEYDPGITTEQWVQLLQNKELTTENNLLMFAMMLNYGKPASCSELEEHFGRSKNYFNSGSSSYAEQVWKRTGCPRPPERINENARWWPILYVGRNATKEEKGSYIWKLRDELKGALEQIDLPEIEDKNSMAEKIEYGLNTILYGPPGTGKTYRTTSIAVSICKPELNISGMTYEEIKEKYNELKKAGRIEFVTFHQSYSYEEFIEGIKPIMDDDESEKDTLEYKIKPGIFKSFCEKASMPKKKSNEDYGLNASPTVWKVSLEGTGDNLTRRECLDNGHIRIGWDDYGPEITEQTVEADNYTGGIAPLNAFINKMKIGDIVLSCYSSTQIDAIGIVTSDYEWSGSYEYYNRLRKVKWLAKDIREDIVELNGGKTLTLSTVYKLSISPRDVLDIVQKYSNAEADRFEPNTDNYVFIIDEINRGNISKIFGELITLIEDTKRAGTTESMEVKLPYSGDPFSVPKNVYILGTMNSADRSIALMDTALRRRFDFIELMPDPEAIKGLTISDAGETLDVVEMLEVINNRIEYLYDREHTIGHAFFKKLETNNSMECLAEIFQKKVVPLLQEYFYEDYEKIQLVLGDNKKSKPEYKFVLDENYEESTLFKGTPELDVKEKKYSIQKKAFDKIQSYLEITK